MSIHSTGMGDVGPLVGAQPNLWRVLYPDGELGDLKNLTWARHEGARVALSLLNNSTRHKPGKPAGAGEVTERPVTAAKSKARQSPPEAEEQFFAINCKDTRRRRKKTIRPSRDDRVGGSMKRDRNHD